jgi:hypothetical protein
MIDYLLELYIDIDETIIKTKIKIILLKEKDII